MRGVLFDFDGLLADTYPVWRAASVAVVPTWTEEDERSLHGLDTETAMTRLSARAGREVTREEILGAYRERIDQVRLMPGAAELVRSLDLPLAVASNSPTDLVGEQLVALGLGDAFVAVVGLEPPLAPKPAPDLYEAAARRLGLLPGECVALDDSPAGVLAAASAGCRVIGVSAATLPVDRQVTSLTELVGVGTPEW
ncbi:HAD family phosphatase [Actinomycetospora sp. NBRC 106378]|uniref:HAD family hydrolase n=1 Tax=Actinomycetospora sp. NBRC 106378 TaxID=3032208 RepID=UPI0024A1C058|nr:HAD family phosphatase [Actinomycetospora sp. NBRC 106378]GLZ51481.1 haloacid dehalogenase [Actinomycetospora sp. NBRC 106378]